MYFTAEDGGNEKLYSVRLGGGTVQTLFGVDKGSYTNLAIPDARRQRYLLYANWESASAPGEIALINPQNGKALVLTKLQRRARRAARPAAHREFLVHLAAAASASTVSWCGRRGSTRRRSIRCSS